MWTKIGIEKSGMRGGERARGVDEVREKKDSRNSIINNLGKIIKF
jgi:hypothetical protein